MREYLANGWNATAAYRKIYGPVKTAQCQSAKLFMKPHIRKRFNQMLTKFIKRADITEERVLTQYQEAYDMAVAQGKTADMVSATTAQAKLVGLLRERTEIGMPGDFDRMESVSDVLEALSQQVGPEVALQIGRAMGVVETQQPEPQEDVALAAAEPASGSIN